MKLNKILLALICISSPLYADQDQDLKKEIKLLRQQAESLQAQLDRLQSRLASHQTKLNERDNGTSKKADKQKPATSNKPVNQVRKPAKNEQFHESQVIVHSIDKHPDSFNFYPTALIADNQVLTYIAGTPVVGSPFLGDRPAFDGSDYIVNISSINRDIRLMQQRRALYQAYQKIGYPIPQTPIISISGKAEPAATISNPFHTNADGDLTLGSSELDVAAALNQNVEAYIAIAYDEGPPDFGPRVDNSAFNLNMGFVNIGNLDKSPIYFTAGQVYVPFGRYSSSMITSPLPLSLARTKTRPIILGYKSQEDTGPFAAIYGYRSDTTFGKSGVGGANLGYIYGFGEVNGEVGVSYISSMDDSGGMQATGSPIGTTFGGFGSITNGTENVRKTQAVDLHATLGYDRYNLTAEWVGATQAFRAQDLSFNGRGAKPQALQTEAGVTFIAFNRPASIGIGYQWSKDALALNLPKQRYLGVFNISIWKDTVESLEYRHDVDYGLTQFGNGAAPAGVVNLPTMGTGQTADTVSAQIGVYF